MSAQAGSASQPGQLPRFAAFISYSHRDDKTARWLHRKLETFRIPRGIKAEYGIRGLLGRHPGKVFRDREEFPAGGQLTPKIEAALTQSDHLIVLCSKHAAASPWVAAEIAYFITLGRGDRIIPVILDTDPPACMPPPLCNQPEILGADLREGKDGRDSGLVKIVAGLLHVGSDDFFQRLRKQQRLALLGLAAIAISFAAIAAVALVKTFEANKQRTAADKNAIEANRQRASAIANAKEATEQRTAAEKNEFEANRQRASAVANAASAAQNLKIAEQQKRKADTNAKLANERAIAEQREWQRAERALAQLFVQRAMDTTATTGARARYALAGMQLFPSLTDRLHLALGSTLQSQERLIQTIDSDAATPLFIEKGHGLIFRASNGSIEVLDIDSKQKRILMAGPTAEIRKLALSRDQSHLAVAEATDKLHFINYSNGQRIWSKKTEVGQIWSVALSADGQKLAIAGEKGIAEVRDTMTGEVLYMLEPDRLALYKILFSSSGEFIATASHTGEAQIWRTRDGSLIHRLEGHRERLRDAVFLGNTNNLATASMDGTIRIWDANLGSELHKIDAHSSWVDALAADRSGEVLISGSSDNTAKIWDTKKGILIATLPKFDGPVYGVAIDAGGEHAASASSDGRAVLVQVQTGSPIAILRTHEGGPIYDVAFSGDGNLLFTSGADKTARIWSVHSAVPDAKAFTSQGLERRTASNKVNRGQVFIKGGSAVDIIDIASRKRIGRLEGHDSIVSHVAVSANGKMIATASGDKSARIWRRIDGHLLAILRGHIFPVELVALSPDARFAVTASRDETARLWDVESGRELIKWQTQTRWMNLLGFSDDGSMVLADGDNGKFAWNITRLNWSIEQAKAFACQQLLTAQQRKFTVDERENDPLIRDIWLPSRAGKGTDVCAH